MGEILRIKGMKRGFCFFQQGADFREVFYRSEKNYWEFIKREEKKQSTQKSEIRKFALFEKYKYKNIFWNYNIVTKLRE